MIIIRLANGYELYILMLHQTLNASMCLYSISSLHRMRGLPWRTFSLDFDSVDWTSLTFFQRCIPNKVFDIQQSVQYLSRFYCALYFRSMNQFDMIS